MRGAQMTEPQSPKTPACLVCERTSEEIPLISLIYRGGQFHVCPEHLPILIHHPVDLVGRLPGAENMKPYEE